MAQVSPDKKPKPNSIRWRAILANLASRLADSSLPAIFFVTTLILARWWKNSDFSYPSEVIMPTALFAALVTIVFYLYRYFLGKGVGVHVATVLLSYGLYSYKAMEAKQASQYLLNLLPDSAHSPFNKSIVLVFIGTIGCGLVGWIIGKVIEKSKFLQQLQPYKVLVFALIFIFAIQLVKTANRLWEMRDTLTYRYPAAKFEPSAIDSVSTKPDIYYLIFDRYASSETLKNIYNFDNSELENFLAQQGFESRHVAYANYPFTMSSVSSTIAMDYLPQLKQFNNGDWQAGFPYRAVINDPPIAQTLKTKGYVYNQISSWWDFTRVGIKADNQPTKSFRLSVGGKPFFLSDLERDIINKSILSPWLTKGLSIGQTPWLKYDLDRNPRQNFEAQMAALKEIAARADKNTPQFTLAHILSPHDPYIFKADGSDADYSPDRNDFGIDETKKYTNQVTYLNKRIIELVGHIRRNSPNAIVIIQADEGPYPKQFRGQLTEDHYYDPYDLPPPQMKQKFGILASYYMPGLNRQEVEKISSSVNVFRFVLNQYFGYNLPLLPECNFSVGAKFAIYDYRLVSEKLSGQKADDACEDYQ